MQGICILCREAARLIAYSSDAKKIIFFQIFSFNKWNIWNEIWILWINTNYSKVMCFFDIMQDIMLKLKFIICFSQTLYFIQPPKVHTYTSIDTYIHMSWCINTNYSKVMCFFDIMQDILLKLKFIICFSQTLYFIQPTKVHTYKHRYIHTYVMVYVMM